MPKRKYPLVTDEYYHVFNRGVNKQPIFFSVSDYRRALEIARFYSFAELKTKYSKFIKLSVDERKKQWEALEKENNKTIDIVCFCLMPNHYHFLLQQRRENGISQFMGNFQNSLTRYVNIKHQRIGPLLQGEFKAIRIEDDRQLLHLSRYIHLNPYTSFVVKELSDLENYQWSSYPEYLGKSISPLCNKEIILSQFKDVKDYQVFVEDRAAYQRELEHIKHLLLEDT